MGRNIVPPPWTTQPQYPAQLKNDLRLNALAIGSLRFDLAKNRAVSLTGSATQSIGPYGGKFNTVSGGTNQMLLATNASDILTTQGCTVILAGWAPTQGANGEFGEASAGVQAQRCGGHVPYSGDGKVYWDFGGTTEGTTRLSVGSLTFKESDVWAFTTGPRGMEIWQNGVKVASNSANPTRTQGSAGWGLTGNNGATCDSTSFYCIGHSPYQAAQALLAKITRSMPDLWDGLFEPIRRKILVSAGGGVNTISATPGAWTWTGTTAEIPTQIAATPGAYSWAGVTATLGAPAINAVPGAYTWAGTQSEVPILIQATPGAWTWTGTQSSVPQLVQATPGAYSWTGTQSQVPTLIQAVPGAYIWTGTTATFGTAISAIPGQYTWAGTQSDVPTQVQATPGQWAWTGTLSGIIVTQGKSHVNLTLRQMLVDYYEREWAKQPEAVAELTSENPTGKRKTLKLKKTGEKNEQKPSKERKISELLSSAEQSLANKTDDMVWRLVDSAIKSGRLVTNFNDFAREEAARRKRREHDDLLLYASIL